MVEIEPEDLDILDQNSLTENGDHIANKIEGLTNESGPDDDDGLGQNSFHKDISKWCLTLY